jgi:hypothetical protein
MTMSCFSAEDGEGLLGNGIVGGNIVVYSSNSPLVLLAVY